MVRGLSWRASRSLVVWRHSLAFEGISLEFFFKKRHPQMLADSGRHSARKSSFSRMSRRVALPEPTSFDFSGRSNRHSCHLGKSVFSDEMPVKVFILTHVV